MQNVYKDILEAKTRDAAGNAIHATPGKGRGKKRKEKKRK